MLNPRLAGRYAKSLLGLAIENGQLEQVYKDMQYLLTVTRGNHDFVVVLKSPVINPEKKTQILHAVTGGNISELTELFIRLLLKKGREMNLPEIASAFIEQYKQHKEIYTVKLTTAIPVSEQVKAEILDKVRSESSIKTIELTTVVDESLIGGFVLQIGNTLVDASISYDLNAIKKQFLNNDFIYKIR
jgi:F-type H+-transporting ATPase subunit delta